MAVRNESVRLSLDDDFTTKMVRAAVATALLKKELGGLDGTSVKTSKSVGPLGNEIERIGKSSRTANSDINKLTGRLAVFRDIALVAGPAIAPLGAAAIGGLVAMTAQLGALAGGLGVTLLAVNGLGDGLKALDAYQLEPTAENLAKLRDELKNLGPAGEDFVRMLDSIEPNLKTLQNAAREGFLPGAEEGLEALLQRLPELRKLIRGLAEEMGGLVAGGGKALAGDGFDDFFHFLRTDGIDILHDTGKAIGNLGETVANLFVAFGGVETDFSGGLLDFTEGLAEASANLDSNAGFQEFVQYIKTEGPHALETLGSIADMFLQIVEAAAPLGGPVLTALTAVSKVIAAVADSDIGTPIFAGLAALTLFNRAVTLTAKLNAATFGGPGVALLKGYAADLGTVVTAQDRATMSAEQLAAAEKTRDTAQAGLVKGAGRAALAGAGLALSMSGVADSVGLANTAMLGVAGPWGAAAGFALDMWNATDGAQASIEGLNAAIASGDLDALTSQIADARAGLSDLKDDQEHLSLGEAALSIIPGGISLGDADTFMGQLNGTTGEWKDTLAAAQAEAERLAAAHADVAAGIPSLVAPLAGLRVGLEQAAEAATLEAQALEDAVDAMRAKRAEALRAVDAELNYQKAILDANKGLKENGKDFSKTTEAGIANRELVYGLADAWNQQSDAAKNAKGSLSAARKNFIETATELGATAAQAKNLADRLFEIPPKRKIDILIDTGRASAELIALKARIDAIKGKTVDVIVNTVRPMGGQVPTDEQATGPSGTPHKKGHSFGGFTGRGGHLEPAGIVHRNEVVIPERYALPDMDFLARRYPDLPGFAAGGVVGGRGIGTAISSALAGGIGPNSQLFGLGSSWLSLSELAERISHLTLKQIKSLGDDIDLVSKKNLPGLSKALDMATEAAEKRLDKERSRRDDIASEMASLAATVSSGLRSDIFAQNSNPWATSIGGVANANATLQGDINQGQMFTGLVGQLQGLGLHGGALQSLLEQAAQSNNLGLLQQFAGASATDLGNYQSLYDLRDQTLGNSGQATGQAVFGAAYAAQTKVLEQTRDETKGLRQDVKNVQKAIARLNKDQKQAHQDGAAYVSESVNGAASAGHRRGRRGPR